MGVAAAQSAWARGRRSRISKGRIPYGLRPSEKLPVYLGLLLVEPLLLEAPCDPEVWSFAPLPLALQVLATISTLVTFKLWALASLSCLLFFAPDMSLEDTAEAEPASPVTRTCWFLWAARSCVEFN